MVNLAKVIGDLYKSIEGRQDEFMEEFYPNDDIKFGDLELSVTKEGLCCHWEDQYEQMVYAGCIKFDELEKFLNKGVKLNSMYNLGRACDNTNLHGGE